MIIDSHAYVGAPPVRCGFSEVDISPEWLIRLMRESGIDKMVVMPPANWAPGCDYRAGTDAVVAAVNRYPDRFIGFSGVTGYCVKHGIADLKYGIGEKGLKGAGEFKAAPHWSESIVMPIMRFLEKHRAPVLIHFFGSTFFWFKRLEWPSILEINCRIYPSSWVIWVELMLLLEKDALKRQRNMIIYS